GNIGRVRPGKHSALFQGFQVQELFFTTDLFQLVGDVNVLHVTFKTGRDQEVLVPIQIHIEEDWTPGPVGGRYAAKMGNFRVIEERALEVDEAWCYQADVKKKR